jgi:predicted glycosyltransferase
MKRILFYCQHVLGMGHFMRSAALVEGLAEHFQICFLNGGEIIPGFAFPPQVEVVNLPPIKSDESFGQLASASGEDFEEVKQQRIAQILATFERWQPDIVIIELYPFGRKKFSFELLPLLARIRLNAPHCHVVCSLRDILVSRPGQDSYEAQVRDILNRYFDLLLIHADPQFQRLEETFHTVADIAIPIVYTGYVAQSAPSTPTAHSSEKEDDVELDNLPLLLASIGGGRVGFELLAATIEASSLLHSTWPHQLLIFSGPYLPDDQFALLEEKAAGKAHILLRRYTTNFLDYMMRATLSISMAGYNTCVNILSTGVRALTLPFTGGDNNEQTIRATKLAASGLVTLLSAEDLTPERLSTKIQKTLHSQPVVATLTLDGVAQTTASLRALPSATKAAVASQMEIDAAPLMTELRPYLESLESEGREFHFFLRDDDTDEDEESLRHLLDIGLSRGVPLNLAVIPAKVTPAGIRLVKNYKKLLPNLLELHQHGWQHLSHEVDGRKCEFGASRSYAEQFADIQRGKLLLERNFGARFFPAFTPPWNRCTQDTLAVLDELGFKVFSKDSDDETITGCRFQEISITLDFMAKGGATMKPPAELVAKLIQQMQAQERIGIMLHHKMMDEQAFAFLDCLLAELRRYSFIYFHTFEELYTLSHAYGLVKEFVSGEIVQSS